MQLSLELHTEGFHFVIREPIVLVLYLKQYYNITTRNAWSCLYYNIIMVRASFSHICQPKFSVSPFHKHSAPWQRSYFLFFSPPSFHPPPSLTSLHSKVSPALAIFGHWSIQSHGTESPAAKWQNEPFAERIWWGGDGKTLRSWKFFGKYDLWSEKELCHFCISVACT